MITKIFAHRGSAGTHPENTFTSFLEAERVGADGIELDVQLTKDDQIVVIHDHTIDRTTNGKGLVRDYTLQELKKLDAGSWFSDNFSMEKIPTLMEVLNWMQSNDLYLNIELKNVTVNYPFLEEKVIQEIERFNFLERVIISSFNHKSLKKINGLNPNVKCAILYLDKIIEPWNYARKYGATSLHPHYAITSPDLIVNAQKRGFPVRVFTINEKQLMMKFLQEGCSAIITDYPEKALEVRKGLLQNW